ncbi:unnamed protein product [Zymoseptoria tritici ST99CH_3D1]|nr:unnamed protein product [Zymoseptoria tritici ST99CH_3D1]
MATTKRSREESISEADMPRVGSPLDQSEAPPQVHTPKYTQLEPQSKEAITIRCTLPPHKPTSFTTYRDYETHYSKLHTNRCSECQKNFPSDHFLELHLAENHDPIVATRRDRGDKTYACFVEGCDKLCRDWKKRSFHLIDKHLFPKNYDFLIVNNGIDGRRSMLRPGVDAQGHRRSSREGRGSSSTEATQSTEATSVSQQTDVSELTPRPAEKKVEPKQDLLLDSVTKSMSSLQFVPRSITFGKRKGKSGFAKS